MALAFIRGLTSGRRRRLVDADSGFDLDLTYITSRIVAMGYPSTGIEAAYRNSAADVARFLRGRHAGNYLLLNLSERPYDESEFDHRVMNVGFPDHHPPPWELLWTITISLDRWLRADPANVVVVHCQAGKGRTGTVIAAALLMRQWFSLAPIDRLVGPELATGLDAMAGALHEDKGTPGRADVEKGAALPELWANGRVPGDGTTSEAFPRGPPWALPALTLPPGAASSEALSKLAGPQAGPGVAPGMLVLRPPTVAARAALRLFWARRGEGVTYPGQARSVAGVAALCWRLPGVVVSGDVTLRLFAAADSGPTAAIGRQVEVYRTTLHTGMLRQMERSSTLVVRTPRGLDMDARKERLRGLAPSARPGTATWLPRRFRLVVHLAPGSKAAAAAELARADYRAGMGRERVADGPTSFPAAPPRAAAAAAGTARSPSATAAPDAVGGTVSASSSRQLTEDERAHALSMEGWVWKRGDLNRTWRRRWLVLRHRSLVYHKEAAGAPAGAVPLSECLRVDAVAREEADGRDFVFAVDTKQRRWLLQAESEEEAAAWLAVLGQAWASLRVPLSKRS
ncbi:hypothetical protein FNF28_02878 [Cafeteria roenbergensis]|uniref:Phosphatidylinositol-3,4,5-trisphosphate 3-phosphatase n=1 Tax=Cafeteria roenbergensis TaxID=33653 RepID=A0A5A8DQ22_CAFRO|nr:hypothetical protein FNF28_02878 [Cafeteria roenbergensis]